MKRYFRYEFVKNLKMLGLLTAICSVVYVVTMASSRLVAPGGANRPWTSQIGVIYTLLGILSFVVPALMYSFKMNKRSADVFYSLPLKREKIYLVKTLVGLILVLLPYTVAYFLGFITVALRENYYRLLWYLPGYFGGLFFGICMYGVSAFAFTRANRVIDGVIFMGFYALVGVFVGDVTLRLIGAGSSAYAIWKDISESFSPVSCFIQWNENIDSLLRDYEASWNLPMFLFPFLFAAVGYAAFFFLIRYEKAENSEQNSDSWFGYRTMIPVYTALLIGILGGGWIFVALFAVSAIVLTVVYTRKVLFSWKYWLMIAIGVAAGLVLNLFV